EVGRRIVRPFEEHRLWPERLRHLSGTAAIVQGQTCRAKVEPRQRERELVTRALQRGDEGFAGAGRGPRVARGQFGVDAVAQADRGILASTLVQLDEPARVAQRTGAVTTRVRDELRGLGAP